jgi:23S rRNA (uracil1939-C5)-methyltransferase
LKRKNLPLLEKIEITDIGARGKAIARVDNFVTFVSNALPGDIVDIQLQRKKKSYQEGKAVNFHSKSDQRSDPFCKHFGVCGGCKWQDLQYKSQLRYKQQEVVENLQRIGDLDLPEVLPILASEKQQQYRNKLEYTFSNKRWLSQEEIDTGMDITDRNGLGFHIPGMFDKVIDLEECYLQEEPSNKIRLAVREYAREHDLTFFDLRNKGGLLRNLIIRNTAGGEIMVIVVFYENDKSAIKNMMVHLDEKFPEITSLMYCINEKANDSVFDQEFILFSGKDHIVEHMEDLHFRIGPKSFFQTNSFQALNLYNKVRDFAGLTGNEVVYDLYSGTGTIGLFLAKSANKIIGIEYIDEAIQDARRNAEINKLDNTCFFSGDIKNILTPELFIKEGRPDVIITDPPRAGMHKDVTQAILSASAKRIVYVSCNPASQARDLAILKEKYKVIAVQPVDMFPQTYHVENIVLLELSLG